MGILKNKVAVITGSTRGLGLAIAQAYARDTISKRICVEQGVAAQFYGVLGVYAFNPGLVLTDMLSQVEAVIGYEKRLLPLETVSRMWGNPPEVPAEKAVWLASPETDGRTGLEVRVLGPKLIILGALREAGRRLARRVPESTLQVKVVPSELRLNN